MRISTVSTHTVSILLVVEIWVSLRAAHFQIIFFPCVSILPIIGLTHFLKWQIEYPPPPPNINNKVLKLTLFHPGNYECRMSPMTTQMPHPSIVYSKQTKDLTDILIHQIQKVKSHVNTYHVMLLLWTLPMYISHMTIIVAIVDIPIHKKLITISTCYFLLLLLTVPIWDPLQSPSRTW